MKKISGSGRVAFFAFFLSSRLRMGAAAKPRDAVAELS